MAIRNAAKALVLHDGKILINKCVDDRGEVYFDLPGGGQHQFETIEDAVKREVFEETGYQVNVVGLVAVAEEIHDNHIIRERYFDYSHRIFHIFLATLAESHRQKESEMDFQQESSMWVELDEADQLNLRPITLKEKISELVIGNHPIFLGSIRMT